MSADYEAILTDWKGQAIYEAEQYRIIDGDVVIDEIEEIKEYLDSNNMGVNIA